VSHYDRGRLVTPWKLEPHCVYGGFAMAWTRWERTENGWDFDWHLPPGSDVFASAEDAVAAPSLAAIAGPPA